MKRSTAAEDGDMALALALHQSELHSAEMQAGSNERVVPVSVQPATCNLQPLAAAAIPAFTCGGNGRFQAHAPQVWHTAGEFLCNPCKLSLYADEICVRFSGDTS